MYISPVPLFFLVDHVWLHISTGGLGVRTAGRGLSLCDVTNLSPTAYRKFSSDARCSTPVPTRKRRCTMAVDYKEPSLNGWVYVIMFIVLWVSFGVWLFNNYLFIVTENFGVETSSQTCSFYALLFSSRSLTGGQWGILWAARKRLTNTMSHSLDVTESSDLIYTFWTRLMLFKLQMQILFFIVIKVVHVMKTNCEF